MSSKIVGKFCSAIAIACAGGVARAQVQVEWERLNYEPGAQAVDGTDLVLRPGGGWYAVGSLYTNNPNLPGIHTSPTYPVLQRIDDQGQLVWSVQAQITYGTLAGSSALAADPGGDAYFGYGSAGAKIERRTSAGSLSWTSAVAPGSSGFVNHGLLRTPQGELHAILAMTAGIGFAAWNAAGASLGAQTVSGASSGTYTAAQDASGRLAGALTPTSGIGVVFVVDPSGVLAWSDATVDFHAASIALGPAGELAAAGVDAANVAHLRVWNATGTVQYDRATVAAPSSRWNGVGFDPWGGVLVAGSSSGDGLVASYDATGTLQWQELWASGVGFGDAFSCLRVLASGELVASGLTALNSGFPYYQYQARMLVTGWRRNGDLAWVHQDPTSGTELEMSTVLTETQGGSVVSLGARWSNNFVNPGHTPMGMHVLSLRPQSRAFCFGDVLSATACPCANFSADGAQEGCANSLGHGVHLSDSGTASIASDSLVLQSEGSPASATSILLQGSASTGTPIGFGDGLRCAGGLLVRMYVTQAIGGTTSLPGPGNPSVSARSAAAGDPLGVGAVRTLQLYYRDPSPAFCPAPQGSTFNVSNAQALTWAP